MCVYVCVVLEHFLFHTLYLWEDEEVGFLNCCSGCLVGFVLAAVTSEGPGVCH